MYCPTESATNAGNSIIVEETLASKDNSELSCFTHATLDIWLLFASHTRARLLCALRYVSHFKGYFLRG